MIDTSKISKAKYIALSPNCRKCAAKLPALRDKISKGWFKKGNIPWIQGKKGIFTAWNKGLKGIHLSPGSEFKKGSSPWNKNLPFLEIRGKNHYNWKGGVSKDKEHIRKRNKMNYYMHPTKKRHNQKYIFTKRMGGELSIKTIQQVYEDNIKKYGTLTCYLCLEPIQFGKDHLEHKTPLSRGGTNARRNLDVACQRCNCKKHNKTEAEYRKVLL